MDSCTGAFVMIILWTKTSQYFFNTLVMWALARSFCPFLRGGSASIGYRLLVRLQFWHDTNDSQSAFHLIRG